MLANELVSNNMLTAMADNLKEQRAAAVIAQLCQ